MTIRLTIQGRPPQMPSQAALMDAMTDGMRDASNLLANAARELVRVKTGGTRATIRTLPVQKTANGVQGGVEAGGAGRFLEEGTATFSTNPNVSHQKYPIRPKYKKALAWPGAQGPSQNGAPVSQVVSGQGSTPPRPGSYVRLSGAPRIAVRRLLAAGAIPFSSVYIVRKGVMHPGIRPRPFMAPALQQSIPKIQALLSAAIRKRMTTQ